MWKINVQNLLLALSLPKMKGQIDIETYDFNKDSNMINKMGYKVQISGISKSFFTIIYIHVPKTVINMIKNNN